MFFLDCKLSLYEHTAIYLSGGCRQTYVLGEVVNQSEKSSILAPISCPLPLTGELDTSGLYYTSLHMDLI